MVLFIDNYDSFVYNLIQAVGKTTPDIRVIRNDELSAAQIQKLNPDKIIISPGPGKPGDAGVCIELLKAYTKPTPILGVCLGHQAIFEAFGGRVGYAKTLMHGKTDRIQIDNTDALFLTLPKEISVARYHSLAGVEQTLPDVLKITAKSYDGSIMAVRHRELPIFGVQFHPESVLTPLGQTVIDNFLSFKNA